MAKTFVELLEGLKDNLKKGNVTEIAKYFVSTDHLKNILRLLPQPLAVSLQSQLEQEIQKRLAIEQIALRMSGISKQQPGINPENLRWIKDQKLSPEDWKKLLPLFSYAQQQEIINFNQLPPNLIDEHLAKQASEHADVVAVAEKKLQDLKNLPVPGGWYADNELRNCEGGSKIIRARNQRKTDIATAIAVLQESLQSQEKFKNELSKYKFPSVVDESLSCWESVGMIKVQFAIASNDVELFKRMLKDYNDSDFLNALNYTTNPEVFIKAYLGEEEAQAAQKLKQLLALAMQQSDFILSAMLSQSSSADISEVFLDQKFDVNSLNPSNIPILLKAIKSCPKDAQEQVLTKLFQVKDLLSYISKEDLPELLQVAIILGRIKPCPKDAQEQVLTKLFQDKDLLSCISKEDLPQLLQVAMQAADPRFFQQVPKKVLQDNLIKALLDENFDISSLNRSNIPSIFETISSSAPSEKTKILIKVCSSGVNIGQEREAIQKLIAIKDLDFSCFSLPNDQSLIEFLITQNPEQMFLKAIAEKNLDILGCALAKKQITQEQIIREINNILAKQTQDVNVLLCLLHKLEIWNSKLGYEFLSKLQANDEVEKFIVSQYKENAVDLFKYCMSAQDTERKNLILKTIIKHTTPAGLESILTDEKVAAAKGIFESDFTVFFQELLIRSNTTDQEKQLVQFLYKRLNIVPDNLKSQDFPKLLIAIKNAAYSEELQSRIIKSNISGLKSPLSEEQLLELCQQLAPSIREKALIEIQDSGIQKRLMLKLLPTADSASEGCTLASLIPEETKDLWLAFMEKAGINAQVKTDFRQPLEQQKEKFFAEALGSCFKDIDDLLLNLSDLPQALQAKWKPTLLLQVLRSYENNKKELIKKLEVMSPEVLALLIKGLIGIENTPDNDVYKFQDILHKCMYFWLKKNIDSQETLSPAELITRLQDLVGRQSLGAKSILDGLDLMTEPGSIRRLLTGFEQLSLENKLEYKALFELLRFGQEARQDHCEKMKQNLMAQLLKGAANTVLGYRSNTLGKAILADLMRGDAVQYVGTVRTINLSVTATNPENWEKAEPANIARLFLDNFKIGKETQSDLLLKAQLSIKKIKKDNPDKYQQIKKELKKLYETPSIIIEQFSPNKIQLNHAPDAFLEHVLINASIEGQQKDRPGTNTSDTVFLRMDTPFTEKKLQQKMQERRKHWIEKIDGEIKASKTENEIAALQQEKKNVLQMIESFATNLPCPEFTADQNFDSDCKAILEDLCSLLACQPLEQPSSLGTVFKALGVTTLKQLKDEISLKSPALIQKIMSNKNALRGNIDAFFTTQSQNYIQELKTFLTDDNQLKKLEILILKLEQKEAFIPYIALIKKLKTAGNVEDAAKVLKILHHKLVEIGAPLGISPLPPKTEDELYIYERNLCLQQAQESQIKGKALERLLQELQDEYKKPTPDENKVSQTKEEIKRVFETEYSQVRLLEMGAISIADITDATPQEIKNDISDAVDDLCSFLSNLSKAKPLTSEESVDYAAIIRLVEEQYNQSIQGKSGFPPFKEVGFKLKHTRGAEGSRLEFFNKDGIQLHRLKLDSQKLQRSIIKFPNSDKYYTSLGGSRGADYSKTHKQQKRFNFRATAFGNYGLFKILEELGTGEHLGQKQVFIGAESVMNAALLGQARSQGDFDKLSRTVDAREINQERLAAWIFAKSREFRLGFTKQEEANRVLGQGASKHYAQQEVAPGEAFDKYFSKELLRHQLKIEDQFLPTVEWHAEYLALKESLKVDELQQYSAYYANPENLPYFTDISTHISDIQKKILSGEKSPKLTNALEKLQALNNKITQSMMKKRLLMNAIAQKYQKYHEAGITHGDIKPENIMVKWVNNDTPVVTIIDVATFGYSRQYQGKQDTLEGVFKEQFPWSKESDFEVREFTAVTYTDKDGQKIEEQFERIIPGQKRYRVVKPNAEIEEKEIENLETYIRETYKDKSNLSQTNYKKCISKTGDGFFVEKRGDLFVEGRDPQLSINIPPYHGTTCYIDPRLRKPGSSDVTQLGANNTTVDNWSLFVLLFGICSREAYLGVINDRGKASQYVVPGELIIDDSTKTLKVVGHRFDVANPSDSLVKDVMYVPPNAFEGNTLGGYRDLVANLKHLESLLASTQQAQEKVKIEAVIAKTKQTMQALYDVVENINTKPVTEAVLQVLKASWDSCMIEYQDLVNLSSSKKKEMLCQDIWNKLTSGNSSLLDTEKDVPLRNFEFLCLYSSDDDWKKWEGASQILTGQDIISGHLLEDLMRQNPKKIARITTLIEKLRREYPSVFAQKMQDENFLHLVVQENITDLSKRITEYYQKKPAEFLSKILKKSDIDSRAYSGFECAIVNKNTDLFQFIIAQLNLVNPPLPESYKLAIINALKLSARYADLGKFKDLQALQQKYSITRSELIAAGVYTECVKFKQFTDVVFGNWSINEVIQFLSLNNPNPAAIACQNNNLGVLNALLAQSQDPSCLTQAVQQNLAQIVLKNNSIDDIIHFAKILNDWKTPLLETVWGQLNEISVEERLKLLGEVFSWLNPKFRESLIEQQKGFLLEHMPDRLAVASVLGEDPSLYNVCLNIDALENKHLKGLLAVLKSAPEQFENDSQLQKILHQVLNRYEAETIKAPSIQELFQELNKRLGLKGIVGEASVNFSENKERTKTNLLNLLTYYQQDATTQFAIITLYKDAFKCFNRSDVEQLLNTLDKNLRFECLTHLESTKKLESLDEHDRQLLKERYTPRRLLDFSSTASRNLLAAGYSPKDNMQENYEKKRGELEKEFAATLLQSKVPSLENQADNPWFKFIQLAKINRLVDTSSFVSNGKQVDFVQIMAGCFKTLEDVVTVFAAMNDEDFKAAHFINLITEVIKSLGADKANEQLKKLRPGDLESMIQGLLQKSKESASSADIELLHRCVYMWIANKTSENSVEKVVNIGALREGMQRLLNGNTALLDGIERFMPSEKDKSIEQMIQEFEKRQGGESVKDTLRITALAPIYQMLRFGQEAREEQVVRTRDHLAALLSQGLINREKDCAGHTAVEFAIADIYRQALVKKIDEAKEPEVTWEENGKELSVRFNKEFVKTLPLPPGKEALKQELEKPVINQGKPKKITLTYAPDVYLEECIKGHYPQRIEHRPGKQDTDEIKIKIETDSLSESVIHAKIKAKREEWTSKIDKEIDLFVQVKSWLSKPDPQLGEEILAKIEEELVSAAQEKENYGDDYYQEIIALKAIVMNQLPEPPNTNIDVLIAAKLKEQREVLKMIDAFSSKFPKTTLEEIMKKQAGTKQESHATVDEQFIKDVCELYAIFSPASIEDHQLLKTKLEEIKKNDSVDCLFELTAEQLQQLKTQITVVQEHLLNSAHTPEDSPALSEFRERKKIEKLKKENNERKALLDKLLTQLEEKCKVLAKPSPAIDPLTEIKEIQGRIVTLFCQEYSQENLQQMGVLPVDEGAKAKYIAKIKEDSEKAVEFLTQQMIQQHKGESLACTSSKSQGHSSMQDYLDSLEAIQEAYNAQKKDGYPAFSEIGFKVKHGSTEVKFFGCKELSKVLLTGTTPLTHSLLKFENDPNYYTSLGGVRGASYVSANETQQFFNAKGINEGNYGFVKLYTNLETGLPKAVKKVLIGPAELELQRVLQTKASTGNLGLYWRLATDVLCEKVALREYSNLDVRTMSSKASANKALRGEGESATELKILQELAIGRPLADNYEQDVRKAGLEASEIHSQNDCFAAELKKIQACSKPQTAGLLEIYTTPPKTQEDYARLVNVSANQSRIEQLRQLALTQPGSKDDIGAAIQAIEGFNQAIIKKTREKGKLLTALSKKITELHHQGFTHQDLKPENIVVKWVRGEPIIELVDLATFGFKREIGGVQGKKLEDIYQENFPGSEFEKNGDKLISKDKNEGFFVEKVGSIVYIGRNPRLEINSGAMHCTAAFLLPALLEKDKKDITELEAGDPKQDNWSLFVMMFGICQQDTYLNAITARGKAEQYVVGKALIAKVGSDGSKELNIGEKTEFDKLFGVRIVPNGPLNPKIMHVPANAREGKTEGAYRNLYNNLQELKQLQEQKQEPSVSKQLKIQAAISQTEQALKNVVAIAEKGSVEAHELQDCIASWNKSIELYNDCVLADNVQLAIQDRFDELFVNISLGSPPLAHAFHQTNTEDNLAVLCLYCPQDKQAEVCKWLETQDVTPDDMDLLISVMRCAPPRMAIIEKLIEKLKSAQAGDVMRSHNILLLAMQQQLNTEIIDSIIALYGTDSEKLEAFLKVPASTHALNRIYNGLECSIVNDDKVRIDQILGLLTTSKPSPDNTEHILNALKLCVRLKKYGYFERIAEAAQTLGITTERLIEESIFDELIKDNSANSKEILGKLDEGQVVLFLQRPSNPAAIACQHNNLCALNLLLGKRKLVEKKDLIKGNLVEDKSSSLIDIALESQVLSTELEQFLEKIKALYPEDGLRLILENNSVPTIQELLKGIKEAAKKCNAPIKNYGGFKTFEDLRVTLETPSHKLLREGHAKKDISDKCPELMGAQAKNPENLTILIKAVFNNNKILILKNDCMLKVHEAAWKTTQALNDNMSAAQQAASVAQQAASVAQQKVDKLQEDIQRLGQPKAGQSEDYAGQIELAVKLAAAQHDLEQQEKAQEAAARYLSANSGKAAEIQSAVGAATQAISDAKLTAIDATLQEHLGHLSAPMAFQALAVKEFSPEAACNTARKTAEHIITAVVDAAIKENLGTSVQEAIKSQAAESKEVIAGKNTTQDVTSALTDAISGINELVRRDKAVEINAARFKRSLAVQGPANPQPLASSSKTRNVYFHEKKHISVEEFKKVNDSPPESVIDSEPEPPKAPESSIKHKFFNIKSHLKSLTEKAFHGLDDIQPLHPEPGAPVSSSPNPAYKYAYVQYDIPQNFLGQSFKTLKAIYDKTFMEHSKPKKGQHQLSLNGFKELCGVDPKDENWEALRDQTIDNFAEEFKFAFDLSSIDAINKIKITFPGFIKDDMKVRFIAAMAKKVDIEHQEHFIKHMSSSCNLSDDAGEEIKKLMASHVNTP